MEFELNEERAKKAYEQMLRFLDFSARSEKELKDKLYEKGYHRNEVDFAIEKGKKYKFVDDTEFTRSFIRANKSRYGSQKILYRLTEELGVSSVIAEDLLYELYPSDEENDLCRNFALKYVKSSKTTKNLKQKLSSHLYSKGFSYSVINRVVAGLDQNIFNSNEQDTD
ncbi:MAG: recombination regulator RecX [Clostridia bacterium]|nr:recombination regulator RecX [Clostridia bacterium]